MQLLHHTDLTTPHHTLLQHSSHHITIGAHVYSINPGTAAGCRCLVAAGAERGDHFKCSLSKKKQSVASKCVCVAYDIMGSKQSFMCKSGVDYVTNPAVDWRSDQWCHPSQPRPKVLRSRSFRYFTFLLFHCIMTQLHLSGSGKVSKVAMCFN